MYLIFSNDPTIIAPQFQDGGLEIVYAALVWNALGVLCEPDDDGLIALFPFATFSDRSSFYCRANRCVDLIGSLISSRYQKNFTTISSLQHTQVLKTSSGRKKKRCQELLCFALYEWLVNKR